MPVASDGDVRIQYELSGREDGELLVLSNSLGSSLRMWDNVPALVIAGTYDPATHPSEGQALAASLENAQYIELNASHLSAWERSDEFAHAVLTFLAHGGRSHG